MKSILALLIMMGIFGGCSAGKKYVEGTICKVGNEPFTEMAIQVDAYTIYTITADKKILNELEKQQGYRMKIFYSKIDSSAGTKKIVFKTSEVINE